MLGTVLALLIFSSILLWAGWLNRNRTESVDYHIGGRQVGVVRIAASTFALVGGGEFVTLTALAYAFGYLSATFFVGVILGFIVFAKLTGQARRNIVSDDIQSSPDFFYSEFGRGASFLATLLAMLSIGSLLVIQFMVGGELLASVTGFPDWLCTIGMAALVCGYVYIGGFNSVLTTDLIQGVCIATVMLLLVLFYASAPELQDVDLFSRGSIPLSDAATLITTGFFAVIGGADVWQRVCSAKSDETATKGLYWGGLGWVFLGGLIVFLSLMIAARHPAADPNIAFVTMLTSDLPEWIAAFVAILLFSALLSTADTELFLLSVLTGKEWNRAKRKAELSTVSTKRLTIGFTMVTASAALFLDGLVDVYFVLLYCMMILGPITLSRMLGRGSPAIALFGLLLGAGTLIYLAIEGSLVGWNPLLILIGPTLSFLVKSPPDTKLQPSEMEG